MKKAYIYVGSTLACVFLVCVSGLLSNASGDHIMGFGFVTLVFAGSMGAIIWLVSDL